MILIRFCKKYKIGSRRRRALICSLNGQCLFSPIFRYVRLSIQCLTKSITKTYETLKIRKMRSCSNFHRLIWDSSQMFHYWTSDFYNIVSFTIGNKKVFAPLNLEMIINRIWTLMTWNSIQILTKKTSWNSYRNVIGTNSILLSKLISKFSKLPQIMTNKPSPKN